MDHARLFAHHLDLPDPGQPLDRKILPSGGGVCALTDGQGRLILTLAGEDLRRSLGIRLERPAQEDRRRRADLRAVARRLWWRSTFSVFETSLTYLQIARQLAPQSYRQELAFGPVWFARINLQDRFPRWVSDKFALTPPTIDIGPFRDRGSCRRFIELLEDIFDLCRYYEVLKHAPDGQACAYKEMGKCPAPCDGSVSMEHYRGALAASVEFARGDCDTRLSQLEEAMSSAAGGLEFERAARIRAQIERTRKILGNDGRLQPTPDSFRYLVIQRGGGTTRIKPFFVDCGHVGSAEAVPLRQVEQVAEQWTDKMRGLDIETCESDAAQRSECIWLVSHFLAKRAGAPGLFLHTSQLKSPPELVRILNGRFGPKRQMSSSNPIAVDPCIDSPLEWVFCGDGPDTTARSRAVEGRRITRETGLGVHVGAADVSLDLGRRRAGHGQRIRQQAWLPFGAGRRPTAALLTNHDYLHTDASSSYWSGRRPSTFPAGKAVPRPPVRGVRTCRQHRHCVPARPMRVLGRRDPGM
ncbi:MAG: UvrB/UvrC motif-containing protein [Planctomycetota bacterium]|jgi:hypothetical protein